MSSPRVDITVANLGELATVHVAPLVDGTSAYVSSVPGYFTLEKNSGLPGNGLTIIEPLPGSPIAGAANARWIEQAGGGGLGCDITFLASCPSVSITQSAQVADVPTASSFLIASQAPFPGATGANRTPSPLRLQVPAAVGGGAEGVLRVELGGTSGFFWSRNLLAGGEVDQIYESTVRTSFAQGPAGQDAHSWDLVTVSPPAIGNRARGGDITMEAGAANGNAGAAAQGGGYVRTAGDGSSGGGAGGDIVENTGNGGVGGGTAGRYRLVLGVPNGAGSQGTWDVFQGGSGGAPTLLLDGSGRFHIGKDTDTAAGPVRLRVNGLVLATVGAAGGAAAQPATPLGYLQADINGTIVAIAFHNAA